MGLVGRGKFNLSLVLSTLVCTGTIAFWVRSLSVEDHLGRLTVAIRPGFVNEHRSGVFSGGGRLAVGWGDLEESIDGYVKWPHPLLRDSDHFGWDTTTSSWVYGEYDDNFPFGFAAYPEGHGVYSATPGYRSRSYFVSVPHWFFALVVGLYPAWRVASVLNLKAFTPRRLIMSYASLMVLMVLLFIFGFASVIAVPVIIGIGIAVVAPRRFRLQRSSSRRARGCCIFCGYDLRASTGRCPECGRDP